MRLINYRKFLDGIAKNGHIISYGASTLGYFLLGLSHANDDLGNQLELIIGTTLAGPGFGLVSGAISDYQTHRLNVETHFPPDKRLSSKKCLVRPAISTALGAVAYAIGYCSRTTW